MEAVPRLPMMHFELKTSPENVDFASKIRQLIVTNFGEDPASFAKEIKELETLRLVEFALTLAQLITSPPGRLLVYESPRV